MMAAYHHHPQVSVGELDSSHNTSSASLVPSVPYPSAQQWAQVQSALPLAAQPAYELIQHRVFVGGFPSAVWDFLNGDLRFFEGVKGEEKGRRSEYASYYPRIESAD